jgi:hypothetical protein
MADGNVEGVVPVPPPGHKYIGLAAATLQIGPDGEPAK